MVAVRKKRSYTNYGPTQECKQYLLTRRQLNQINDIQPLDVRKNCWPQEFIINISTMIYYVVVRIGVCNSMVRPSVEVKVYILLHRTKMLRKFRYTPSTQLQHKYNILPHCILPHKYIFQNFIKVIKQH